MKAELMKNGRGGFSGPFIVLGMVPSWPAELERRKDYKGPHTSLASLVPLASGFPQIINGAPPAPKEEGPIGGINSDLVLKGHLSPLFLERLEKAAAFMHKPRTARQVARATGASMPTAYALIELLRRRGFPLEYGERGRSRTFQIVVKRSPHARA